MTGYELIAKMRKTRRRYPLTATEQALYNELVAICNEDVWQDPFSCSNEELCAALHITENTLNVSRLRLIQAGLIFYKSGKSKRQFGKYSLEKEIDKIQTTSNIEVNPATNTSTNPATNTGVNTATNPEDCNKAKPNQTKQVALLQGLKNCCAGYSDNELMEEVNKIIEKYGNNISNPASLANKWAEKMPAKTLTSKKKEVVI